MMWVRGKHHSLATQNEWSQMTPLGQLWASVLWKTGRILGSQLFKTQIVLTVCNEMEE